MRNSIVISILCAVILFTHSAWALLSFQVLESKQFKILYPKRHHEEAIKMLHSFENAYTQLAKRFNRTDTQKIVLILEDHGLYANGSVSSQYKQIRLFRYYSTHDYYNLSHHNWYDSLAMHELVHYFQFYQSSGVLTLGQSLFGRYFTPNTVVPSSLTEGLAVYYESQISPYSGRLNDGYAHAIATTQKAHQTLPKLGHLHFQTSHYPFANWYLYGGLLVHQLDKKNNISRYHEALQYHANYSPSLVLGYTVPSLGIDQALQQKDLGSYSTLYSQWIDSIPENTKPKSTPLFSSSHNSFSKLVPYKKGFIVNQYKRPYHHSLGQSASNQFLYFKTPDSQPINILSELGLLLTDIHIIGDYLYYAVSTPEDGYANYSNKGTGYEAALIRLHIPTQTRTIVFKKAISSFSIDEHHHIWYWKVSRNTHESTLYKFDGNTHSELFTMPLIVHESDQNKKELYLSAKTEDSSLDIYRFVKNTKQLSPLFQTPSTEYDLLVKNNTLYFTANYNKAHQRYAYLFQNNTISKFKLEHYSRSGLTFDKQLIYIALNGNGESIRLAESNTQEVTPPKHMTKVSKKQSLQTVNYSGFWTNSQTLFQPRFKGAYSTVDQLRFSFYGEDRLQSLKYAIDFNSVQQISKDAQWHVESQLLRPLSIALSSKTVGYEQRYYQFYSDYLLYRFDGKGIQNISLISKASRYFNRTDYAVGTSILFKTPLFSQTLSLETRLNQTSHKWSIRHKQPLRSSIFSYHFTTYYNYLFKVPSRSQNPFYIQDRSGHTHELDLSIPVYSINKGSWSPNIWLNTLVFTPFFDFTHIDRASTNLWHYGATLSLNVHHSLSSHNVIYIGYSKNNFDETEYFYGISIL